MMRNPLVFRRYRRTCVLCIPTHQVVTERSYRTSHGSVSVVRTTFKVYGKRQTLTLSQPKTPKPIVTKFEWRDYVVDAYHQKKLGSIRPGVFVPHVDEIYLSCSKFTTLFWYFNSPTGESVRPIFTLNTSNDAVLKRIRPTCPMVTDLAELPEMCTDRHRYNR